MLLVYDRPPLVRDVGVLLVVIAGTLRLVVLLLLLLFFPAGFSLIGGLHTILRSDSFDYCRLECWVTQPVQRTLLLPASCCLLLIRVGVPSRLRFKGFERFMMSVFSFMSRHDALHLDESLNANDISSAWLVCLVLLRLLSLVLFGSVVVSFLVGGLVLGMGSAVFRVVRLGGHQVRKARANVADALGAADVFLYRDSSIAPLLDMRRRFKTVMDVLDAMIRYGVLSFPVGRTHCSVGRILAAGPLCPVALDDLSAVPGLGISDFILPVVVHRRDEAIRGWRNWIREDPMVHPYRWLRPDLVPPAPFLQCKPRLTPDGSGVLSDLARIGEEFRKVWLPYFCRSGQRETSLDEFNEEVDGGYRFCLRFIRPG